MGGNKTYYYIKKKPQSVGRRLHFFNDRPEVVAHHSIQPQAAIGEQVLDLDFSIERPHFWIGLLRWVLFVVLATLVYVTGVFLYAGSNTLKEDLSHKGEAAAANLQRGAEALQKMDVETALADFQVAEKNFNDALSLLAELGQSNVLLSQINFADSEVWQGEAVLLSGKHLASAGIQFTEAIKPLISYWSGLTAVGGNLQSAGTEIGKILIDNSRKIDAALVEVKLAGEILDKLNVREVDPAYASVVAEAQTKTAALQSAVDLLGNLAKNLPKALGFTTPQYYLLLNQNSNELRPTGGFIGSVVMIKLYQGKIEEIAPDTAQRLDGQNQYSSLELPAPLKAVTAYYGIRDANWEPNFPTTVRTLQKLYQEAGGGSVDGVIALTPGVVTDILSVIGPITMPKYGFDISADNFIAKTQQRVKTADLGKDNPKQVLIDFVPLLINQLIEAKSQTLRLIEERFFQRLVQKDILIYFSDPQLEKVVTNLNWSGEIKPIGGKDDYLYVVDANLGGNKSSSSIVKEMYLTTQVKPDATLVNNLTLKYNHTGTAVFPDGINKNYVRVYVPMGSHITQTVGQDEGTQVDIDSADGKTVVGFWLTTPPGETKEVKLEYELPFRLNFVNSQAIYRLVLQKQSGSDRTVFSSYVTVADNMDLAVKGNTEAVKKDMLFSDKLTKDEIATITIRKYK